MSQGRAARPTITNGQPLERVHATVNAIAGTVKNADDARTFLFSKGWIIAGEPVALDTLARTLFAAAIEPKVPTAVANATIAVAYLLTERLENGIKQGVANKLTEYVQESIDMLTSDLQDKIGQYVQAIEDTTQAQTAITEKLQKTQERMEETAQSAVRTYSQIASTPPPPVQPHLPLP